MLVKVLLITKSDSEADLIKQQLPIWYGDGVSLKRVRTIKEGFDELELASRIREEYDRIFWNPDQDETQHVSVLKQSFPTANIGILSSGNLSVGIRAYAESQKLEAINLSRELNRLKEVLDYEIRRKSSGTERIQLNREIASLEVHFTQHEKQILELQNFVREEGRQSSTLVERTNQLILQSDILSKRLDLVEKSLGILEKDQIVFDDRLNDLEDATQPGRRSFSEEEGKSAGKWLAILLAILGLLGAVLPALFSSLAPSVNKWIDQRFNLQKDEPLIQPSKKPERKQ